jgi:integrase
MPRLTDSFCRHAAPGTYSDGSNNLQLRVEESGRRSFRVVYRTKGERKPLQIGRYPTPISLKTARGIAARAMAQVAEGRDPAAERKTERQTKTEAALTFSAGLERYLAQHVKRLRSADEIERILRKEFESHWNSMPLRDIRRRIVQEAIDGIEGRGARVMARNAFAHLKAYFRWLVERELIAISPMAGMRKPGKAPERDRVLTDKELVALWQASEQIRVGSFKGNQHGEQTTEADAYAVIVKLLVLTACRRSEVADLDWSEVDTEHRQLALPASRTKAGERHIVPLTRFAWSLLPAAEARVGKVFPRISNWSRLLNRLREKMPEATEHFTLHDIRRSVASGLQRLGVLPVVIEATLGHSTGAERGGGIRRIYQRHDYALEKRQALAAWSDHIAELVGGRPTGNVIGLRGRSARRARG